MFSGVRERVHWERMGYNQYQEEHVEYEQNHFFAITPYKIFATVKKIQSVTRDPSPNPIKR